MKSALVACMILAFFSNAHAQAGAEVYPVPEADASLPTGEKKPEPVYRNGMKFIPLDRKRMVVKPLSRNQPAVVKPFNPIVTRKAQKNKNASYYGGSSDSLSDAPTSSGSGVLSVFPEGSSQ